MYADYLKERENLDLLKTNYGFVIYEIRSPWIYIKDVYVDPKFRKRNDCWKLDQLAISEGKNSNCKFAFTSLCLKDKNWWRSKRVIRKSNYKFYRLDKPTRMVYFIKEI